MPNINLNENLSNRKLGFLVPKRFKRLNYVTENFIKSLSVDKELTGHTGCVNCLDWNESGELLVSGSDDTYIKIWDPFNNEIRTNINTLHTGNIFSVKFLSKFNDTKIVSGAADFLIKVMDISKEIVIDNYECHQGRVKRLAVSYNEPNIFWSCSEDGTVRQFDIRENPLMNERSPNVLINLVFNAGTHTELKCLAINPTRPDQIAVGCNDPYVRLYDRRTLSLKPFISNPEISTRRYRVPLKPNSDDFYFDTEPPPLIDWSDDVVQYFVPGHIPYSSYSKTKCSTTHVTFSPDGVNLLVNMGTEQVYLYDVNKLHPIINFQTTVAKNVASCDKDLYCDYSEFRKNPFVPAKNPIKRSCDDIELISILNNLKEQGNEMYKNSDYHSAVKFYNTALKYNVDYSANIYANRAAAYMARNWMGDTYAALLDSMRAIQIDDEHIKSHFRIAQCLYQLNMIAEAHDYVVYLQHLFPEQSKKIKQIGELQKKIMDKISNFVNKEQKVKPKSRSVGLSHKEKANADINLGNVTNILEIINKNSRTRKHFEAKNLPNKEYEHRSKSNDYVNRYCGHCNKSTDIKEANFFGIDGQFIMAGSDDGNIFFWDRQTESIVRVLRGDTHIVNCLQPHPTMCMLATSGLDPVVRLWVPINDFHDRQKPEDDNDDGSSTTDSDDDIGKEQNESVTTELNRERLESDPFEVVLLNMGVRTTIVRENINNDGQQTLDPDSVNDSASSTDGSNPRRVTRIRLHNGEYCRSS